MFTCLVKTFVANSSESEDFVLHTQSCMYIFNYKISLCETSTLYVACEMILDNK